MSSICPICNGMQELHTECPRCSAQMNDCGRPSDLLGPYSPYLESENVLVSSEESASATSACLHLMDCPGCDSSFTIAIDLLR